MDFYQIKDILTSEELPGYDAQRELAPPYRFNFSLQEIKAKKPRKASVLIVIYQKDNQFLFPVILRTIYDGVHSGQIGLPGGKQESFDLSNRDTALRETQEELGLDKNKLEIIRKLTPLYIPPSNFYVQPYVAFYKEHNFIFDTDHVEVQKVFEIELHRFLFNTKIVQEPIPGIKDRLVVPAFSYNNIIIWGATAMMLNEFKLLLKSNIFTSF